jgi:hypothetical protein
MQLIPEALLPNWPSEIDLVGAGERAGTCADSAADDCTFERSTDQGAANQTNARPDSGAAERTIARAVAAAAERKEH